MEKWNKSLIIVGPSTSGKTEIAFRIAKTLGGELINADKYYLVKGFPTMTGLPDFSTHPNVRSHLYAELDPTEETLNSIDYENRVSLIESQVKSRGNLAIIEGSYHRFIRCLLSSGRPYLSVGIKWSGGLEPRVRKRVEDVVFSEERGIEEVRAGLKNGWRDTYVMKHGSAIRPIVEYLDGDIGLELAREKIVYEVLATAYKAYRKFLDFPEIHWQENSLGQTEKITQEVIELIKKSNKK
jgi:tRNA A37 N6-isopentenylltransferase MiaA